MMAFETELHEIHASALTVLCIVDFLSTPCECCQPRTERRVGLCFYLLLGRPVFKRLQARATSERPDQRCGQAEY
jgi:hypothetical protein